MARGITNLTQIGLIAEVTAGTTPSNPALQLIRATSEGFNVERHFVRSEQFNPVAQIDNQILVSNRATGKIAWEWADGEAGIETILESCLFGAWSTDILLAGTTAKSLTFEIKHEAGANDQYKRMVGMQGSELTLDFNTAEKIVCGASFVGMGSSFATSGISGATYPAAGTEPVNVTGDMTLTSAGITVDAVTKLSMRLANELRVQQCLGSFDPSFVSKGTTTLTGDIEFYLNTGSFDQATAYLANTSFTLVATAGNTTLKKTKFEVPKAKFTGLTLVAEGNNQDLMVRGQWEGFYDSATTSLLKVTRNVA